MPQLTSAEDIKAAKIQPYGLSGNNNTLTLHERLLKRFQPHEFVRVRNIDDEPVVWQYMPAESEDFEYTPDPMKITHRGQPEMWQIEPGQTEVIIGANAYMMVNTMYKNMVAKSVTQSTKIQPGQARNFNFADGAQMEKYIDEIFVGKEQPVFGGTQPQPALDRDETYEDKAIEAEKAKKTGVTGASKA